MKPGELLPADDPIVLNPGRPTVELRVENTSGHTVFVGSHYPFFEVNRRLRFDRARAWGMHLDVPAGDTVGWRPGETKTVRLVAYGGRGVVRGFHGLTGGPACDARRAVGVRRATEAGFAYQADGDERPAGEGAGAV